MHNLFNMMPKFFARSSFSCLLQSPADCLSPPGFFVLWLFTKKKKDEKQKKIPTSENMGVCGPRTLSLRELWHSSQQFSPCPLYNKCWRAEASQQQQLQQQERRQWICVETKYITAKKSELITNVTPLLVGCAFSHIWEPKRAMEKARIRGWHCRCRECTRNRQYTIYRRQTHNGEEGITSYFNMCNKKKEHIRIREMGENRANFRRRAAIRSTQNQMDEK